MSDIVERLRKQAWQRSGAPKMDAGHTKMLEWEAADEIERLEDALRRIMQWADAYPIDGFHEPTKEEFQHAHTILRANKMTLDAFSASMARHCMKGVGEIARKALEGRHASAAASVSV